MDPDIQLIGEAIQSLSGLEDPGAKKSMTLLGQLLNKRVTAEGSVARTRAEFAGRGGLKKLEYQIAARNRAADDAIKVAEMKKAEFQLQQEKAAARELAVRKPGSPQLSQLLNRIEEKDFAAAARLRSIAENNAAGLAAKAQEFVIKNIQPGVSVGDFTKDIEAVQQGKPAAGKMLQMRVQEANVKAASEVAELQKLTGSGMKLSEAQGIRSAPENIRPLVAEEAMAAARKGRIGRGVLGVSAAAVALPLIAKMIFGGEKQGQAQLDPQVQMALAQQMSGGDEVRFDKDSRTMARLLGMIKSLQQMSGVQNQAAPSMARLI